MYYGFTLLVLLAIIYYIYSIDYEIAHNIDDVKITEIEDYYVNIPIQNICNNILENSCDINDKKCPDPYNNLSGDDMITLKMLESGTKPKRALTNRALMNKNTFIPYFEEELRSHAAVPWWDDETLEDEF